MPLLMSLGRSKLNWRDLIARLPIINLVVIIILLIMQWGLGNSAFGGMDRNLLVYNVIDARCHVGAKTVVATRKSV